MVLYERRVPETELDHEIIIQIKVESGFQWYKFCAHFHFPNPDVEDDYIYSNSIHSLKMRVANIVGSGHWTKILGK